MNRYDIITACNRFPASTVPGKAVRFLAEFMDQVDQNSDGWAYWQAPSKAARKMMAIVQNPFGKTQADYQAALVPIKSFMTRKGFAAGMQLPVIF